MASQPATWREKPIVAKSGMDNARLVMSQTLCRHVAA